MFYRFQNVVDFQKAVLAHKKIFYKGHASYHFKG